MNNDVRIELITDPFNPEDNTVVGFLDVEPNTNFPITFSVQDIRDISKKTGVFSKTLTLSGSKNNNILMNNYFDVNISAGSFDLNKKQQVIVYQSGIPILSNATIQLVSVNKIQDNTNSEQKVTYSIILKDSTGDLFSLINNKYLHDLDFSDMDHIYTADNVAASFDYTVVDGYKYLMPGSDKITANIVYPLDSFLPGIYAKRYLDRIFGGVGYSYTWSNMSATNVLFDKLIVPYNGDAPTIDTTDNDALKVVANSNAVQTLTKITTAGSYQSIPDNSVTFTKLNINAETEDPSNAFNTTTSVYTSPNIPNLDINYNYDISYEIVLNNYSGSNAYVLSESPSATKKKGIKIRPLLRAGGQTEYLLGIATQEIFLNDGLTIANGVTVVKSGTTTVDRNFINIGANSIFSLGLNTHIYGYNTDGNGQSYKFYTTTSRTAFANVQISIKITDIKLRITPKIKSFAYNVPVKMNKFVPKQIKQSDFVKSIFTMYNIVAEPNPDNINNIILKTRDTYYDDGKIVNWDKKINVNKPQDLQFLPELSKKKLLLTYKEDKDAANVGYKNNTGEIYGQIEYTFNNEYVKDIDKKEIIFSPTPIKENENRTITPIYDGRAPKTNIRILVDGGTYTCDLYYIENYTGGSQKAMDYYPHISHFNKPLNPTFDLNFGTCDYYFMTNDLSNLTNNNLYNLFWRRTINQINDGKLMIAYFDINEFDITNMKLSDKIEFDNSYWNINKIIDYNPNIQGPTKIELISIDTDTKLANFIVKENPYKPIKWWRDERFHPVRWEVETWSKWTNDINTRADVFVRGDYNSIESGVDTKSSIKGSWNIINSPVKVFGNRNFVDIASDFVSISGDYNEVGTAVRSLNVMGSNNRVMSSSTNINIMGSNNTIAPNVERAVVLGNDSIVTTSDSITISGPLIISSNLVQAGRNEIINMFPANKVINLLSASRNTIRQFGSYDVINLVSGSRYSVG